MALIGFWKCNERPVDQVTSVLDYSGHANNHDFTSVGFYDWFSHLRGRFLNGCRYSENNGDFHASVNNNADFLLTGNMTISAWVRRFSVGASPRYIVGCGNGASELQADNLLWALVQTPADGFGMIWEQGAGVDVTAYSPGGELDYYAPSPLQHIAVVRTINGAQRDVKFYVDGADILSDVTGLTAPDGGANAICEMLRLPGGATDTVHGNIALVRVYDTAETAPSIAAIYAADLAEVNRLSLAYTPELLQLGNYPTINGQENQQVPSFGLTNIKVAVPTGTRIDQEERPESGWSEEMA